MKNLFTISLFALATFPALAQLSNYNFIREGGQMSYIDPTAAGAITHTVMDDMVLPAKVKIGFPFKFNGKNYDSLGISENGFIWFGPAQADDLAGIVNPITSVLPSGVEGVVCAFGIDLHPHLNTSLTTTIRSYKEDWAGSPNNFRVEWRNTSRIDALNDPAGEDTLDFQIQLFALEADRVQITYGYAIGLNPNITSDLSVGMKASQTDFAIRATDATHDWDNTITGASLNNTCVLDTANNPGLVPHNYMSWLNNNPTGLKNIIMDRFSVYPVPATDVLYINQKNATSTTQYDIYTTEGKLMQEGNYTSAGIPTSNLNTGIYLIKISSDEGTATKRFVKN